MDGAGWLLLVSGVGVGFGWQPLGDGSPRYEYVVQVEPEVAARLADGHSLPIVADVPAEVQPIGRIRVVVGRDDVPRQRMMTLLKPATDGVASGAAAGGGVELAQYNAAPRYGSPPAQNPYPAPAAGATAPQETASVWNSQPDPSITPTLAPPSSQQLFGQPAASGATWNSGATTAVADATASATNSAMSSVEQGLQQAVAPVQEGLEKVDSQIRSAVGDLGQRTQSIVDELRQPFKTPAAAPTAAPTAAATGAAPAGATAWNGGAAAPPTVNPLRTGATAADQVWNNPTAATSGTQPPSTPPFASSTSGAPAPTAAAGSSAAVEWNHPSAAPTAATSGAGAAGASVPTGVASAPSPSGSQGDPWAGVPDPRTPGGAAATSQPGAGGMAERSLPYGGFGSPVADAGPKFPLGTPTTVAAASTPPGQAAAGTATVGSHMLTKPADRPLDESAPAAATAAVPAATSGTPTTATAPPTTPPWATSTAVTATTPPAAVNPATAPAVGRDNTAAILLAWVLLSGSIAGNLYLFWSYLDVRQKYRSLVRKTARAVGSRFSAA